MVFYDQLEYGLFRKFSSDKEIREYVKNNLEDAFANAVFKKKDAPYFLNIASVQCFGSFEWEGSEPLLHKLLNIYTPIIQKFIADALCNSLQVPLDEEVNPQEWMRLTTY